MSARKDVALLTGASSGIGLEMAALLAGRGVDLVLVARSADKLEGLGEKLRRERGVTVHALSVDLSEPDGARRVFDFTRAQGIEIDILVNNAGVGVFGEHTALDRDKLDRMLQLNINAVCDLCHLFGAGMRQRKKGRILNVASTAAYQPVPFFAAYGASKAFVLNFSEALAKEMEDHGVTVSCLSPGPTDTGFFSEIDQEGIRNSQFDKAGRAGAREVAEIGIQMMFKGQLSRIVGTTNNLVAFSSRLAPRSMVANISKLMLRPKG